MVEIHWTNEAELWLKDILVLVLALRKYIK